ncbi:surface lipoprotein assembly modifier [Brevundimonas sp. NPDC092305]|uniref:surface lipoprotein assembly modifier n=1 Tax=Brevundimonas sp. NPDC092305 TaxID=3363957 RepID=UPI00382A8E85
MLFAALILLASPVWAQDTPSDLTPAQVFQLAEARAAAGAVEDASVLYDALSRDPDPEIRAEARYRKGLLLADAGRYDAAAVAFRALLDEKPDAIAARLELARMFAAMGREADARRELRQARATGIPPDAAPLVDQFAAAIRSPKGLGGSFEIGLAPDTNINRATQARTLDTIIAPLTLSEDARAQSGLGLRVAGQAYGRLGLTDQISVVPRVSTLSNVYDDKRFNDVSASALLGLEWRAGLDRVTASAGRTYRWFAGDLYASTDVVSVDWVHPLDGRSQLVVSGSAARASYKLNALQNGGLYDASASYERALDARSGISLSISGTRQSAEDPGYATWGGGVTAGSWLETNWGTIFASVGARRTEGDERLFLFPERRKDWMVLARAGVTLRALTVADMSPTIRLNVEDNSSTVGIYDYRRMAVEFGLSKAF